MGKKNQKVTASGPQECVMAIGKVLTLCHIK